MSSKIFAKAGELNISPLMLSAFVFGPPVSKRLCSGLRVKTEMQASGDGWFTLDVSG